MIIFFLGILIHKTSPFISVRSAEQPSSSFTRSALENPGLGWVAAAPFLLTALYVWAVIWWAVEAGCLRRLRRPPAAMAG